MLQAGFTQESRFEKTPLDKNGFIPLCIPYLTLPSWPARKISGSNQISLGSLFFPLNPSTPAIHKTKLPFIIYLALAMRKCSWGKWNVEVYGKCRSGNGCCKCGTNLLRSLRAFWNERSLAVLVGMWVEKPSKDEWGVVKEECESAACMGVRGCLQSSSRIREWPWPVLYPSATSSVLLLAGFTDYCNISWFKVTNNSLVENM